MGIYHAAIGIIEGIMTTVVIYLLAKTRPNLVSSSIGVIA
ncbi:MAG: hypothetical protein V1862_00870 [Methanobacteriota archaeon]